MLKDTNNNYIKDNNPILKLENKKVNNDIINFYFQINQLKNLYRQGWLKSLIGEDFKLKCESVADHSFSVGVLAISIIEKYKMPYNVEKCLKLSLIHEFGEIYAGDITPLDNIDSKSKHNMEREAVKKLLSSLNFDNYFLDVWEEYEARESQEAIFIKEVDKLEFLLQASVYDIDISYCKRTLSQVTIPVLKEIVEELIEITKNKNIPANLRKNINM